MRRVRILSVFGFSEALISLPPDSDSTVYSVPFRKNVFTFPPILSGYRSASVRCAAVNAMRCDRENRSFLEALSEEKIPATLATEIKYTFAFWKRQEEEEKKKQAENK